MWNFLLAAALAASQPIDLMLDQLDSAPDPVSLEVRLLPSNLDPDVLWMPWDGVTSRQENHWIPPLRLGITEKSLDQWPAQEGTREFCWTDQLERPYYLPLAQRFATQRLPFLISVELEAARNGQQSCTLQAEVLTTVVSDANAISVASTRIRRRQAEGQILPGQTLVISNLYPFEEVQSLFEDMPLLGAFFLPSTTGPMVAITLPL